MFRGRYKRNHQVAFIGINTSSPTLSLHYFDAVRDAVVFIDLDLCTLMPTVNNRGANDPCEERGLLHGLHHPGFQLKIVFEGETFCDLNEFHFAGLAD